MYYSLPAVYERAVQTVPEDERLDVYFVYIARVTEVYGAVRTREIYDAAMQAVNEKALPELALRYAGLERRLGEVDRARAIYTFACQSADPRKHVRFWNEFKMFETQHGNEDTIRDMIKVRLCPFVLLFSSRHLYNTLVCTNSNYLHSFLMLANLTFPSTCFQFLLPSPPPDA